MLSLLICRFIYYEKNRLSFILFYWLKGIPSVYILDHDVESLQMPNCVSESLLISSSKEIQRIRLAPASGKCYGFYQVRHFKLVLYKIFSFLFIFTDY